MNRPGKVSTATGGLKMFPKPCSWRVAPGKKFKFDRLLYNDKYNRIDKCNS